MFFIIEYQAMDIGDIDTNVVALRVGFFSISEFANLTRSRGIQHQASSLIDGFFTMVQKKIFSGWVQEVSLFANFAFSFGPYDGTVGVSRLDQYTLKTGEKRFRGIASSADSIIRDNFIGRAINNSIWILGTFLTINRDKRVVLTFQTFVST